MHRTALYAFAGLLFGAAPAWADVVIIPEARTQFHNYVIEEEVEPVIIEDDIDVGVVVPDALELAPVPDVVVIEAPELKTYRYVYVGNRIAIVEPETRRIVTFVD